MFHVYGVMVNVANKSFCPQLLFDGTQKADLNFTSCDEMRLVYAHRNKNAHSGVTFTGHNNPHKFIS